MGLQGETGKPGSDGGTTPGAPCDEAGDVMAAAGRLNETATPAMEACAFGQYLDAISDLATATNRFIDATEPFKRAKDPEQQDRLGIVR